MPANRKANPTNPTMNSAAALLCRLITGGVFLMVLSSAGAAELRGRVADAITGRSLAEAPVTLTPSGGGVPVRMTADLFGRYAFTGITAGPYVLEASYSGYTSFSELRSFAAVDLAARDIPLTPLVPGTSRIDLTIQVFDTSTGRALKDVPVRIQRYKLLDNAILEETISPTRVTDASGAISLRSQPQGWFTFRFNDAGDGSAIPFYQPMEAGTKRKLEVHHTVIAQLLPTKQSLKIVITGPDPADLGAGMKPLRDVSLELVGFAHEQTLPPDFDPTGDDARDFLVQTMQTMTGRTNDLGEFVFAELPPVGLICTAKRPGWKQSQGVIMPAANGTLPTLHTQAMALDHGTRIEVSLTSPYRTDQFDGIPVKLEGIEGTNTAGIERTAISFELGPTVEFPDGATRAEFFDMLPGRYRASVDANMVLSPARTLDEVTLGVKVRFLGEVYFEAPLGTVTRPLITLNPVPATIRGRFFKADSPADEAMSRTAVSLGRWMGPAYRTAAQTGIEFTESVMADYLLTGHSVVSVNADDDGVFSLSVLPGSWGLKIPSADGYFGSNYRSVNTATGEIFELGWPYAINPDLAPFIPLHPFGSLGIPLNSGDELDLDLYVRKQVYLLNGIIIVDPESQAQDRVIARTETQSLLLPFCHLAETCEILYDGSPGVSPYLISQPDGAGGNILPGSGAGFLIEAQRGTHSITLRSKAGLSGPHFTFPGGTVANFVLPDFGSPGAGGRHANDIIPMEKVWEKLGTVPDPFTCDYQNQHTVEMRFSGRETNGDRVLRFTRTQAHFAEHPDLGDRLFAVGGNVPWLLMKGDWTLWRKEGDNWYSKTFTLGAASPATYIIEFDLIEEFGGASAPPPSPVYNLRLRGENFHDPNYRLGGLSVLLAGGAQLVTPTGGDKTASLDGTSASFVPTTIQPTGAGQTWISTSNNNASPAYRLEAKAQETTPEVTVTLPMKRGSLVKGRLLARRTAGATEHSQPLSAVPVTLRNRFGVFRTTVTTSAIEGDDNGRFTATLPSAEVLFVEVELNGYYPLRLRVEANADFDTGTPGSLDFNLGDLTLDTLPEPTFADIEGTFDRRGLFLVGVRKGKDSGLAWGHDPDVIATYTVKADTPPRRTLVRPKFDSPGGAKGGDETLQITDAIEAIYLIDPRSFPGNPTLEPPPPALPHVLYDPPSAVIQPPNNDAGKPDPLYPRAMQAWLQGLLGTFPGGAPPVPGRKNSFFIRRTDLTGAAIPGVPEKLRYTATGPLDLASLPPGLYEPWIVARTRRGAWLLRQWTYADKPGSIDPTDNYLSFYGLTLPKWLNGLCDLLGTIKASETGGAAVSLQAIMPDGWLTFEPRIGGDIEMHAATKTLIYTYSIGASLNEGADTPAVGLLALGSGFTGLSANGDVILKVAGSSPDSTLAGHPSITLTRAVGAGVMGDKQKTLYKPTYSKANRLGRRAGETGPFNLKPHVAQSFSTQVGVALPHRNNETLTPLQAKIDSSTSGGVSFAANVDLTPFAAGLPVVGPPIVALGKIKGLIVEGRYEPGVGAEVTRSLTTRYTTEFSPGTPNNTPARMLDSIPLAPRRSPFGEEFLPFVGDETKALLAGLKTGLHLGLQTPDGGLGIGARATIATTGSRNPSITLPSLRFEMNKFGDWPLIKRVSGNVTGTWEAYLRAYVFKFTRTGEWLNIPIDQPFNTYATIQFIPYTEVETSSSITTETPIDWWALEPHMAGNYSGFCSYATATVGGAAGLAVLDPGGPGGAVRVKFSKETAPGVWSAPVTVASASAVTAMAMNALASGAWMLIWAEVPAGSLSDLAPATTLKFSTSATGATWTAPATLTTTTGTAFDIRLVPMTSSRLGMIFMQSRRGPDSALFDLGGATYATGAWSAAATLIGEVPMTAWDLAGPGFSGTGPARIAFASNALGLASASWDGAALSPPEVLDPWKENAQCQISASPGGAFMVAAQRDGGGIALYKKGGPAPPWMPLTPVFTTRSPQELELAAVTSGATTHHLLAWTEGADTRNLAMAWLSDAGAVGSGPFDLTADTPGRYGCLRCRPVPGSLAADLFTVFENGGTNELRVFGLSEAAGLIVTDRDGDSLADMAELRIVDANAADGIRLIDEVTAAADFDGDSYSNGAELTAGTDPIDPHSFPGHLVEITAGADTAAELAATPGYFIVSRTGNLALPLTITLAITGTAANGTDCTPIGTAVSFGAGVGAVSVTVTPVADTAAEGDETIIATLLAGAGYGLGAATTATVTIQDLPLDAWRFTHFSTAELANQAIGGVLSDAEADALPNLLEYAFDSDPKGGAGNELPVGGIVTHPGTGERHLALAYLRRKGDLELIYVVQLGSDLTGWTAATGADIEEISLVDNHDGTETVTVRARSPLTAHDRRFFRLQVHRAE